MADIIRDLFIDSIITKQQIRRGIVRVFWRLEDIMLDYPKANQILSQIIVFLHLRSLISNKILTHVPAEIRPLLYDTDAIKDHFSKELAIIQ